MNKQIFVNLPVKDLKKSMDFFKALGFPHNPQFTDDTAACIVIHEDSIYAMLLTHDKFKQFTPKTIADSGSAEVLIALSCESADEVKDLVKKAVAAGGKTYAEANDMGFMYQHGFQDLDGHTWELVHMDMSKFPGNG